LAIINIQLEKKHKLVHGRQGIEGTGRLSSRFPSAVKFALLLSSFNSLWCIYVGGAARWVEAELSFLSKSRSRSGAGVSLEVTLFIF